MEQTKRSAIAVLADAGHSARDIVKMTKLPKVTVYRVYKNYVKSGTVERRKHSTRSDNRRTPRFLAGLKRSISANPNTPMTTLAKNRHVSVKTIHKAVHDDLGLSSYVRRRRNLLTAKAKAIRAERCPKLLSYLKHKACSKILIWVDEKKFIVDAEVNRQNSRVIAADPSEVPPVLQTKNPASAMVFGAVASDGTIMDPYFIEAGLYEVKALFRPSNNPDLNLLDYYVWGTLQGKVNASPHSSVAFLKSAITKETRRMDKDKIVAAAKRFRGRVEQVIAAQGGHIE